MTTFKPGDLVFHKEDLHQGRKVVGIVVKVNDASGEVSVSFTDTIKPETYWHYDDDDGLILCSDVNDDNQTPR